MDAAQPWDGPREPPCAGRVARRRARAQRTAVRHAQRQALALCDLLSPLRGCRRPETAEAGVQCELERDTWRDENAVQVNTQGKESSHDAPYRADGHLLMQGDAADTWHRNEAEQHTQDGHMLMQGDAPNALNRHDTAVSANVCALWATAEPGQRKADVHTGGIDDVSKRPRTWGSAITSTNAPVVGAYGGAADRLHEVGACTGISDDVSKRPYRRCLWSNCRSSS